MVKKAKKERIKAVLAEAMRLLCQKELDAHYKRNFIVQGLLGITLDNDDILLIDINEMVTSEMANRNHSAKVSEYSEYFGSFGLSTKEPSTIMRCPSYVIGIRVCAHIS